MEASALINHRVSMVMSVFNCFIFMRNSVRSIIAVSLGFGAGVVFVMIKCFLVELGPYHL